MRKIEVGGFRISGYQKKLVCKVLESSRLSYGPMTEAFEKKWAEMHGVKYALFCNSGTSALQVGLHALKEKYGWKDGDEVIIPSVTFVATMNIVLHNNMKPVFVDVDKDYFNIDPARIEEKITSKTRAIIPVHLLGQPAEMDSIMEIAIKHNLKVIEDSCLVGNTLIPTKTGIKKIKDIKIGDRLLGFNGKFFKETIVENTMTRLVDYKDLFIIKFANGLTVKCTKEHPFYVDNKWIKAKDLKEGNEVWHSNWGEYTAWRRNYKLTPRGRAKIVKNMRKNNPSFNSDIIRKSATNRFHRPSRIETRIMQVAQEYNLPLKYTGNGQLWIGSEKEGYKNPDFVVRGDKKVIEVYDSTFQYKIKYKNVSRDGDWRKTRSSFFAKYGYETKFLELSGWVSRSKREDLSNELRQFISNGIKIISIKKVSKGFIKRYNGNNLEPDNKVRVYNLHCEPYNNFILTSGILVHNCETVGAFFDSQPVGSFGDVSCFSTYASHLIVTGVGGFACTTDDDLAIRIKGLYNHGRDGIYHSIDDDDLNPLEMIGSRFNFVHSGYSYRSTELESALGLGHLRRFKEELILRINNAAFYSYSLDKLEKNGYLTLPKTHGLATHSFMLYPIVCNPEKTDREKLIKFLEKNGIMTRYLMPLTNQPITRKLFGNLDKEYPVASFLNENAFLIGVHQELTEEDLKYVVGKFYEYYGEA